MNKVSSRFFDLLNSIIDDLKRSVDLCWLFDLVLHSSLDLLVLNAEEPFNPKIWAWLGLCRCAHICFYFCGLRARCVWFWPQKLHHKIFMIYLKYTNILPQRMQVWWWPQKSLHPPISVPLIPICHSHWCSLWLKQICTSGRCLQDFFWLRQLFTYGGYWDFPGIL